MLKKLLISIIALVTSGIATQGQILFRVEGNGLEAPSYLMGTHHKAPLSILDSIPSWHAAFDSAGQVVGEIDMTGGPMAMAMTLQQYMTAPADSTLSKVLDAEDYKRASSEFDELIPGTRGALAQLDMLRPMAIASVVTAAIFDRYIGDSGQEQLDSYLQNLGASAGKIVVGLETVDEQGRIAFCSRPIARQAKSLLAMLDNPEETADEVVSLTEAYMARDLAGLLSMSIENAEDEEDRAFMEELLDKRNRAWLAKLPALMKKAPSFVAVGALHLAGPDGLVEGLRRMGYTVTPVEK